MDKMVRNFEFNADPSTEVSKEGDFYSVKFSWPGTRADTHVTVMLTHAALQDLWEKIVRGGGFEGL